MTLCKIRLLVVYRLPSRRSLVGLRGWSTTLELEQGPGLALASSEEYWTMNESLIQQYYLNDEDSFGL